MKFNTTLMLTALAAAPVVAQAAPADAAPTYVSLAKPATAPKVGAVLRASVMPGLALLPADVECCAVSTEIRLGDVFVSPLTGGKAKPAATEVADPTADDAMPMVMPTSSSTSPFADSEFEANVTSYAIGAGKGMAASLNTVLPVLNYISAKKSSVEMAEKWAEAAGSDYADTITGEKLTLSRKNALAALSKLSSTKIAPIYGIVTMNHDGGSAMLPAMLKKVLESSKGEGAAAVKENGWQGWKYNLIDLMGEVDHTDAVGKDAIKVMKNRSIYHIFKVKGNALICCICESPADVTLADGADESVLGTDKLAFYDASLSHKLVCTGFVSPELLNAAAAGTNESYTLMGDFVATIFKSLARENKAKSLTFGAAARGVDSLSKYLKSISYEKNAKPLNLGVWQVRSGAYHAILHMDACGASYAPGELKLSKVGASDKTIFYTESTPYTVAPGPRFVDMIAPAVSVYSGYDATLSESEGMGEKLASRSNSVTTALKSVGKSLGNASAFVVFDVKGTPNATYYNTITNAKSLASAGNMLSASVSTLIGDDRNTLRQYYKVKSGKDSSVVSFKLPAEMGGLQPSIICAGNKIAIGSSAALNQLILKNAVGKAKFAGAVYTLRPSTLAGLAAMAGAVDPGAALVAGMAGAALGQMGEIHAVDTITDGVRSIHVLVKQPAGKPGLEPTPRPMPGAVARPVVPVGATRPMPSAPATDDDSDDEEEDDSEDTSDEEEEEETSADEEEEDTDEEVDEEEEEEEEEDEDA